MATVKITKHSDLGDMGMMRLRCDCGHQEIASEFNGEAWNKAHFHVKTEHTTGKIMLKGKTWKI